jgi:hypothetical protein
MRRRFLRCPLYRPSHAVDPRGIPVVVAQVEALRSGSATKIQRTSRRQRPWPFTEFDELCRNSTCVPGRVLECVEEAIRQLQNRTPPECQSTVACNDLICIQNWPTRTGNRTPVTTRRAECALAPTTKSPWRDARGSRFCYRAMRRGLPRSC